MACGVRRADHVGAGHGSGQRRTTRMYMHYKRLAAKSQARENTILDNCEIRFQCGAADFAFTDQPGRLRGYI